MVLDILGQQYAFSLLRGRMYLDGEEHASIVDGDNKTISVCLGDDPESAVKATARAIVQAFGVESGALT